MEFYVLQLDRGKVGKTYPLVFQAKYPVGEIDDFDFVEGRRKPDKPLELVPKMGAGTRDIHTLFGLSGYIISEAFVDALLTSGSTGWGTYPVIAHGKKGVLLPGYSGLVVRGRATGLDRTRVRSEVSSNPFTTTDFVAKGYRVRKSTWDGLDVFFVFVRTGCMELAVFLTSRAANALRSPTLRGFTIVPVEQAEWLIEY